MIDKLMDALVAAVARWAGVDNIDELISKIAKAVYAEFADDLDKIEALPLDLVGNVRALINQAMGRLPFPFNGFHL